ncbi:MAG: ATP-binding cassette domain-containing protein [Bdellovibrionales bacterium]|nr:ATP-binding cassette domain-containing protein [Bdellovibrionales bacterium]
MKQSSRRILQYLQPYTGAFLIALLCTILFGASEGGIPFIVKYILDGIFAQKNEGLLYWLPLVIVGFALFRGTFDFLQSYLLARLGHLIVKDIRNDMDQKILSLSPAFFVRERGGDILSRVTNDVVLVRTLLTDSVSAVIRDSIRVVVLLGVAFYLDALLAAIAFVAFPIAVYPVTRFAKRVRKFARRGQDGVGNLSSLLQQTIIGSKVVQVFGRESFELERFKGENSRLTDNFVKSEKIRSLTGPINEVTGSIAIVGVVMYGGYSVIEGVRSQGDFIAFLATLFLLYEPFKKLTKVYNAAQQGLSAADRIFELLDEPITIEEPKAPVAFPKNFNIAFRGVTFSYDSNKRFALSDVSFEVMEGERIALVGFSGAGKSTLVDLVPRFIDPQSGVVTIGGIDLRELSLRELRSQIAMVGQHTFLFNDTIYNNIAYGKADATREQVEKAAKTAFAASFIEGLPLGYETQVGEGGFSLSGGERQRIAIARAVLKDAPILILDEATASLDNKAEREVQAALEALEKERTSLVIAHRLSTVRSANKIVVFEEGRIVEIGGHEELLAKGGLYKKLHAMQFKDSSSSEAVALVADAS